LFDSNLLTNFIEGKVSMTAEPTGTNITYRMNALAFQEIEGTYAMTLFFVLHLYQLSQTWFPFGKESATPDTPNEDVANRSRARSAMTSQGLMLGDTGSATHYPQCQGQLIVPTLRLAKS
jgi:hypothetical protein